MTSSAFIALLYNISELARRYGMKPSEADATIDVIHVNENDHTGHYELSFSGMPKEKMDNYFQMGKSLGIGDDGVLLAKDFGELEDAVDRAFSLAPRPRNR